MAVPTYVAPYVREQGPLKTPLRVVRLANAVQALRDTPAWARHAQAGQTLVKLGPLRVVVTALPAGMRLDEHQAAGALTLHCLSGRLVLDTVIGGPLVLSEGEFIALDSGIVHGVEAITDCAFLLTIAQQPIDAAACGQHHASDRDSVGERKDFV